MCLGAPRSSGHKGGNKYFNRMVGLILLWPLNVCQWCRRRAGPGQAVGTTAAGRTDRPSSRSEAAGRSQRDAAAPAASCRSCARPTSPSRPVCRYPSEAPKVKDAVITHSHIDHLGMAPWLSSNHRTLLHGTALTAEISEMMWYDCHKVSSIEKYPLAWDKRDIDIAMESWKTHNFEKQWEQEDWKLSLHKAGHIPGAAMLKVDTPTKKILFTGDFDTRDSPLASGAKPQQVDTLFVEGTYGGRNHPDSKEETDRFLEHIEKVVDRGGTALIPSFANGRTQDVVMTLHQHLPELDVHVDGMGKQVAKLQMEHPEALRDPQALKDAWKWCKRVSSKSDKKKALEADCIVSTSGMMDGGPSIWYLNRLRTDPRNAILLTGYQAKGSGGRMLLDEKHISQGHEAMRKKL